MTPVAEHGASKRTRSNFCFGSKSSRLEFITFAFNERRFRLSCNSLNRSPLLSIETRSSSRVCF